ncbi:Leucine-rich repeat-containing protein 71, partial [Dufourea novaeangliae]
YRSDNFSFLSFDVEESPSFYLTYEGKKQDIPKKIESTDELPNCRVNAYGVMQIGEMLTNIGCLRDLNLDMNPNAQENFHLLCQPAGKQVLLFLSLRHCEITDDGVKKIANELQYQDPPNEPRLISLSLSNNHITCIGAGHVGSMLRTNRSLKSLSLLGNRIRDEGASLIIKELKMYGKLLKLNGHVI